MHAYIHTDLDLKGLLFVTKIGMSQYTFVVICDIKSHENLMSCFHCVTFMQTDRHKKKGTNSTEL